MPATKLSGSWRRARQERERLLSKTEIVQAAAREADRLVAEAESTSKRIRAEAEVYVESKLANFEVVLQKTCRPSSEVAGGWRAGSKQTSCPRRVRGRQAGKLALQRPVSPGRPPKSSLCYSSPE